MHVFIGIAGVIAVLAITVATEGAHAFTGFLHRPALILLVFAPPFVALTSYRPEELLETVREVLRALRSTPSRARAELYEDVSRFASEFRRGRAAEALSIADSSAHPLFRQLAPLVVRQYEAAEIEKTAGTAAYCLSSSLKRTEDVLTSLAHGTFFGVGSVVATSLVTEDKRASAISTRQPSGAFSGGFRTLATPVMKPRTPSTGYNPR